MPEMFYKIDFKHNPTSDYPYQIGWMYDYGSYRDSGYQGALFPVTTDHEVWQYCVRHELEDMFGPHPTDRLAVRLTNSPRHRREITLLFRDRTDSVQFALWIKGQSSSTLFPIYRNYPY